MVIKQTYNPMTLLQTTALKWFCIQLANGTYLEEKNFDHIVRMINMLGRRLDFDFDYSCYHFEALETVLLKSVQFMRKEFVESIPIREHSTRDALSRKAEEFGHVELLQSSIPKCELPGFPEIGVWTGDEEVPDASE